MAILPVTTTAQRAIKLRRMLKQAQFSTAPQPPQSSQRSPHGMSPFIVKCVKDGGAAGGGGTTCTWTFTLSDHRTGSQLATAQPKRKGWHPNVKYETPNPLGVDGEAYRDAAGNIVLWDVVCNWETEEC